MPSCLIIENDGRYREQIRESLTSEGWTVRVAEDVRSALDLPPQPVPDLVFVNSELVGAEEALRRFSKDSGPGSSVALRPENSGQEAHKAIQAGDASLQKPFYEAQIWSVVRSLLSTQVRQKSSSPDMKKLTSAEIFGDVLAELEIETGEEASEAPTPATPKAPAPPAPTAPARKKPPAKAAFAGPAGDEIQRKLEQTLSGVLEPSFLSRKPGTRSTAKATPKRDRSQIDKMLSESLSGLDLGNRLSRKPAPKTSTPASGAAQKSRRPRPVKPVEEEDLLAGLDLSFLDRPKARPPKPSVAAAPPPSRKQESETVPPELSTLVTPSVRKGEKGAKRFGHYTLLERIAVGGMAEVWKARMDGVAGFQKTVAIKKILPHLTENKEFERMFVDEAKLAAELNHPNITHIYDLGHIQDEYYIAMEYVEGGNLRTILDTASTKAMPIPQELALLITSRMASALDYAHRKRDADDQELGLVHRDVSPQNVLISYEGDIKLCDFGIVKAASKSSVTKVGALKGKLQYMAPEQAWGREVDGRSDIFSLGTLLFEMLTGAKLFSGDDEFAILERVRECNLPEPRDMDPTIPARVNDLAIKALAREPGDRFQSADRFRDEVESCLEHLTLRPSNADLAAYLRRLMSAEEPSEEVAAENLERSERVAHFPLPAEEPREARAAEQGSPVEKPETPKASPTAEALPPSSGSATSPPAPHVPLAQVPLTQASTSVPSQPPSETKESPFVAAVAPVGEVTTGSPRGRARWLWAAAILILLAGALFFFFFRDGSSDSVAEEPETASEASAGEGETSEDSGTASDDDGAEATASDKAAKPKPQASAAPEKPQEKPAKEQLTTQELLGRERKAMKAAAAKQLARQEAELRRSYEAQQKRLEAELSKLEETEEKKEPDAQPSTSGETAPTAQENKSSAASPQAGVRPPVLVSIGKPQYPAKTRGDSQQGEIVLSLLVNERGGVDEVRQVQGVASGLGLNEAAIAAARAATFKPATQGGSRVKMWTTLKIPYRM